MFQQRFAEYPRQAGALPPALFDRPPGTAPHQAASPIFERQEPPPEVPEFISQARLWSCRSRVEGEALEIEYPLR